MSQSPQHDHHRSDDLAIVRELVGDIEDPELPHVTLGDLGIVRAIEIHGSTADVTLTPTYTGCPATDQIRDDVEDALRQAGYTPSVRFVMSPPWTTDWITERGRDRLRAAGITPPAPVDKPGITWVDPPVACPRCGSRHTSVVAQFGSTACKASYVCRACTEPFDYFKAI